MADSLFEALTGYPESTQNFDAAGKGLLGPGGDAGENPARAAAHDDDSKRSENDFPAILQFLKTQLHTDKDFPEKMKKATGLDKSAEFWEEQLRQSQEIVNQSKPTLLGGPGNFREVDEELQPPGLLGIPASFSDDYVSKNVIERYRKGLASIDLKPKDHRFEDDNALGILGWLLFNGPEAVTVPRGPHLHEQFSRISGAAPFRRHSAADPFVYKLDSPAGTPPRIALFADFGTGLGHSLFIARQLDVDRYHAAFSLGDVYYTGTFEQYKEYFETPLDKVLKNGTQLYVIPDNHDGYSGFNAYLDFLDRRLKHKGSYFAVETEHVQFIGVDTIWHSDRGRIQDESVRNWLKERFAAGRNARRTNILMTGHHPYEYQSTRIQELNNDVLDLANGAVDLWFWGNTHYCALFDKGVSTPYFGSCIGHGGYPYGQQPPKHEAKPSAAQVLFVESGSRYEGSPVRSDRGMNGFCALEIVPNGDIELHYRDWRGADRCDVRFAKQANGSVQLAALEDHVANH